MSRMEQRLRDRRLRWDACRNVRDLGGLPVSGGGTTAWGVLVRADTLCRLTPAGRTALLDYGIRTVIGIRFPAEVPAGDTLFRDPRPAPARFSASTSP